MFIAILTYKKPLEEVDRFLQAHREYLADHYAAGDFIASGPQTPRVGGVIMIKAENRTAVGAAVIASWLKSEYLMRQWRAGRYERYPVTPEDVNICSAET